MGDRFNPKSESSYLQYQDANNLYGWAMLQPLPTEGFKCIDVNPNEISEKLVPNLRDKKNYIIHIQALNQVLQHGLRLDKIH